MKQLSIKYILILFISGGCSSLQVFSDYDKSVDFSKYDTFMFYGWSDNSGQVLNELDQVRFERGFAEEFAKRGWKFVEQDGDAVVSLFIVMDQKTSYTSYTDHYGAGMYGGMYGPRYGWGMPMSSTTQTTENDYVEGTLVVDVFDAKEKKQIWHGVAKKTINENPNNRETNIKRVVEAIMDKFPIQPVKASK
jgi:hypothetical protein